MRNLFMVASLVLVLSGCSGKMYTIVNPNINDPKEGEQKLQGVIAYQSINAIELYILRTLVDKQSGNVIGHAPDKCEPQKKIKLSVKPDYSSPYRIVYEPGLLESNKFGVVLKDGMLSSVNVESDPTKGASAIAELLPFFKAPKIAAFMPTGKPLCNAEPKFFGLFRAPDIRPFEDIPE